MYDLYRLGIRRGIDGFTSYAAALEVYNSAHKHIMQNKPYDEDMQNMFKNFLLVIFIFQYLEIIQLSKCVLQELESIIKTGWKSEKQKRAAEMRSNRERIFTAMGFAGNHWYRCIQGHLYVVADCGALNQAGACPECGSIIGRGSVNINAVRDETAIRQQINNVVDIFPAENQRPPTFEDRSRNSVRNRPYNRGRNRRR